MIPDWTYFNCPGATLIWCPLNCIHNRLQWRREAASTPISEDAQLSALRQVVKKEEAPIEMKQRDKNLASYEGTPPANQGTVPSRL